MSSELGKFIKYKRGDRSLREFATYLEISHAYLDSLEKGFDPKTKKEINISTDLLSRLSKKLHVSVGALLDMIGGTDYNTAIYNDENNYCGNDDFPNISEDELAALFDDEEKKENELIAIEKGIIKNQKPNEFEVLFYKHKDILTEEDKEYIKFIIEQRRKKINEELGEE